MLDAIKSFLSPLRQPNDKKKSTLAPILPAITPPTLHFPLHTERQQPLYPTVKPKQQVSQGEIIANTLKNDAPLHAPINGTILDIAFKFDNQTKNILLKTDTQTQNTHTLPIISTSQAIKNIQKENIESIHAQLEQSGVVGMGGAAFSTIEKIKISYKKNVHTVVINLCECEPIIICDQALTEYHTKDIIVGILLLIQCVQAKKAIIVIENNKPLAIQKLQESITDAYPITLFIVKSIYPSGHEKQLVEYLSGEKLREKTLPYDYGYAVFNVSTCYALQRAYYFNEPLTKRILTISDGNTHINQWALIGTPIKTLLHKHAIDYNPNIHHLIMGGPMNGQILTTLHHCVSKNMNCLLVLPKAKHTLKQNSTTHLPCIRCGECVDACPVDLLPQQLYWFAKAQQHEKLQNYRLFDCIECGNCAFVCPSKIPLVQYYRIQKKQISEKALENYQIQQAKERFEKRNIRLEKEKEKHKKMLQEKRIQAQQKLAEKQNLLKEKEGQANLQKSPSQAVAIARAKARARKQKNQSQLS